MPSIPKPNSSDERQCWECVSYKIRVPLGAYCYHWESYFPNQRLWAFPDKLDKNGKRYVSAGRRTCGKWKAKIVKLKKYPDEEFVKKIFERKVRKNNMRAI